MPDDPSIAGTVKTTLEAAALAVADINTVMTSLNTARSVFITIGNNTSKDLVLLDTAHQHGGFSQSPPGIIPKQTSAGTRFPKRRGFNRNRYPGQRNLSGGGWDYFRHQLGQSICGRNQDSEWKSRLKCRQASLTCSELADEVMSTLREAVNIAALDPLGARSHLLLNHSR
jgi:hypothetical protein